MVLPESKARMARAWWFCQGGESINEIGSDSDSEEN
jgi:hypothetical protein